MKKNKFFLHTLVDKIRLKTKMEHMLRVHKYISNTSFDNATQKNAFAKMF